MPGVFLWGWDATNKVWVKVLVNAAGKLIIDPTEILENDPSLNEHGKAPDSDWAYDEEVARAAADLLRLLLTGGTMSGAIAMGAHKITGLADPTDADDALCKGTRVTAAELPDGTKGQVLTAQGAGVDPAYADPPQAKFSELTYLKALFFKRAESLGNDGGDVGFAITHGNETADEPLYSSIGTVATANKWAYSFGSHKIARALKMPEAGIGGKLVFEARVRQLNTGGVFSVGFTDYDASEPNSPVAHFFYNGAIGTKFFARSYQAAEEQTDTGIIVANTWHTLRIEITAAGINFYIEGALVATHTTQIPNAGLASFMNFATVAVQSASAASKYLRYEYVAVWNEET